MSDVCLAVFAFVLFTNSCAMFVWRDWEKLSSTAKDLDCRLAPVNFYLNCNYSHNLHVSRCLLFRDTIDVPLCRIQFRRMSHHLHHPR